jgi:hypothetical protein
VSHAAREKNIENILKAVFAMEPVSVQTKKWLEIGGLKSVGFNVVYMLSSFH